MDLICALVSEFLWGHDYQDILAKRSLKVSTLSSTEAINFTASHGTCAMSLENWSAV